MVVAMLRTATRTTAAASNGSTIERASEPNRTRESMQHLQRSVTIPRRRRLYQSARRRANRRAGLLRSAGAQIDRLAGLLGFLDLVERDDVVAGPHQVVDGDAVLVGSLLDAEELDVVGQLRAHLVG